MFGEQKRDGDADLPRGLDAVLPMGRGDGGRPWVLRRPGKCAAQEPELPAGWQYLLRVRRETRTGDPIGEAWGEPGDENMTGVLVVFCAAEPEGGEFLVTGWCSDARVHRRAIEWPGEELGRSVNFTARDATLVAESERCFRIPRARDNPPSGIGGSGMWNFGYGLNEERAGEFREPLGAYIGAPRLTRTPREPVESRQRRSSERLEGRGAYRQFISIKGCRWPMHEVTDSKPVRTGCSTRGARGFPVFPTQAD